MHVRSQQVASPEFDIHCVFTRERSIDSFEKTMQEMSKRVVLGSMVVAGVVALAALADLVMGVPFSGSSHTRVMDIIFIICSAIVIYLSWTVLKEMS
jgi:hypothetical protein